MPSTALVKALLRRCHADMSLKLPWDERQQYGLFFTTEVGAAKKEVLMDTDAPLWIFYLDQVGGVCYVTHIANSIFRTWS